MLGPAHGLSGVGKTVLLNELMSQVSDVGWITTKVEASPGATPARPLEQRTGPIDADGHRPASGTAPQAAPRRVKAFYLRFNPATTSVSVGAEVDFVGGVADSGRFADDLAALFEILGDTSADLGIGRLILVDELQEATPDELTAVHQLGQGAAPLPVTFVGAGLPSLPAQLADATSYAERLYDYRPLGLLDDSADRTALVGRTTRCAA